MRPRYFALALVALVAGYFAYDSWSAKEPDGAGSAVTIVGIVLLIGIYLGDSGPREEDSRGR